MSSPTVHPNRTGDRFGGFGLAVVGFAAAVLSFQTWDLIAVAVGFTAHWTIPHTSHGLWIAWLYPVAIDWFAVVVTRVWLRARRGSDVAKFARWNSIGAILLAFGAQAVYHAMSALRWDIAEAWPFVILVGGLPPALVGLVVHLYHELANEREEQAELAAAEANRLAALAERTAQADAERAAREAQRAEQTAANPVPRPRTNRTPVRREPKTEPHPELPANVLPIDRRTEQQIADDVRSVVRDHWKRTGRVIGRHPLADAVRVGYRSTRPLIDTAVRELRELGEIPDEEPDRAEATG